MTHADERGTIESDLPCAVCGYNLKGIAAGGKCPECGRTVARTLRGDLYLSEPAWLRRQANNMFLLAALGFPTSHWAIYDVGWEYGGAYRFSYVIALLPNILGTLVLIYAAFRLSGREAPDRVVDRAEDPWRRALRLACVAYAACYTLCAMPASREWRVGSLVGILLILSAAALAWLVPFFLSRLAGRGTDASLRRHATLVVWALPIQLLAQAGLAALTRSEGWRSFSQDTTQVVTTVLFSVLQLVQTVIGFAYLLMLGRLYETLRTAARVAEGEAPLPPVAWPAPVESN